MWVCCLGHTSLASLPTSTKDTHAILGQSLYTLGQARVIRVPGDSLGGQHTGERTRSGYHPVRVRGFRASDYPGLLYESSLEQTVSELSKCGPTLRLIWLCHKKPLSSQPV